MTSRSIRFGARVTFAAVGVLTAGCTPSRPGYFRGLTQSPSHMSASVTPLAARIDAPSANTPTAKAVPVDLTEWRVAIGTHALPAGSATFEVHNRGTVAHQFEIEGNGLEQRTHLIPPDSSATLTVTLKAGTYELYCPGAGGTHKKMGMRADIQVGAP